MKQSFFDPGQLRHRLSIEKPQHVADGCGGLTTNWVMVEDIWAQLQPFRAKSDLTADQKSEHNLHKIVCRFRSDLLSGWRFFDGNRTFEIVTITNLDERGHYLECLTKEEGR